MRILDKLGPVQESFQLGEFILQKIIEDLKTKLPFLKKKRLDEEEDEELDLEDDGNSAQKAVAGNATNPGTPSSGDDTAVDDVEELDDGGTGDRTIFQKLKEKINSGKKEELSKEDDDVDADAAAKKKKSRIIQIAIGLGLVIYLAADHFMPDEEAPIEAPPVVAPMSSKKKPPVAEKAPAETSEDTAPVGTEATEVSKVTASEGTEATEAGNETPTEATATTEEGAIELDPETNITEPTTDNSSVDTLEDPTIKATDFDSVDTTITEPPEDNFTEKILEDLENQAKKSVVKEPKKEYVAPPDYEYRGRGLVYNCKGKHWACIDGPSYKSCEDNASSNKFLERTVECYPFNVYETVKGCENMQNRMVSSSAKTSFCSEN